MYAPEEELYNSNFTNIGGGGSYDYKSTYNDNTSFFEALNRLPLEFYSFSNDFRMIYYELLKRLKFFMNFSSEIIDDARNFAREPEDYERTKNNTDNIYDNIYTFNYEYIDKLPKINKSLIPIIGDKKLYVYNLVEPKTDIKISTYYNIDHSFNINELNGEGEYIYSLKCNDNNNGLIDSDCKIMTIDDTKCINKYEVKEEDTSDYKNIII